MVDEFITIEEANRQLGGQAPLPASITIEQAQALMRGETIPEVAPLVQEPIELAPVPPEQQPGTALSLLNLGARGTAGAILAGPALLFDLIERARTGLPIDSQRLIEEDLRRIFPADPKLERAFIGQVAGGVGQLFGFVVPAGLLGKAAQGLKSIRALQQAGKVKQAQRRIELLQAAFVTPQGAALQASEGFREAVNAGGDEDQIFLNTMMNAGLGLTEALPLIRAFRILGGGGSIVKDVALQAIFEGTQEGYQFIASDAIAKYATEIDPVTFGTFANPDWDAINATALGARQAVAVGGAVGLIGGTGIAGIAKVAQRNEAVREKDAQRALPAEDRSVAVEETVPDREFSPQLRTQLGIRADTPLKELQATVATLSRERGVTLKDAPIGQLIEQAEVGSELAIAELAMRRQVDFRRRKADAAESKLDRQDREIKKLKKGAFSPQAIKDFLKREFVDVNQPSIDALLKVHKRLGRIAEINRRLLTGATPRAERQLQESGVWRGLSTKKRRSLDRIVKARSTVALEKRLPDIKSPISGEDLSLFVEEKIPETLRKELNERATSYFVLMRQQVIDGLEGQTLTKEGHDALLATGDYSRRQVLEKIDPGSVKRGVGRKITVASSGIDAISEGTFKLMETDTELLARQTVIRTQAIVAMNKANLTLRDIALDNPDNGIVTLAKQIGITKEGKPKFQETPAGFARLSVLVEGRQQPIFLREDVAESWETGDPAINANVAEVLQILSGARFLKLMATGINPAFAITNFFRDSAYVFLTSEQYSPHMFIRHAQLGRDLVVTAKDAWTRGPKFDGYVRRGGGQTYLATIGQFPLFRKIPIVGETLATVQNYLSYFGTSTEIWVRLALEERGLVNGLDPNAATFEAANYLDFSQGGHFIKALDRLGLPYFNASVQATRGIFRAAGRNPGRFAYMMAQAGALSMGLYFAHRHLNPEAWDSVPEWEKDMNWIITTPIQFTDDDGNKRWLYFKIPKDQGQRLIATIFEAGAARSVGDEFDLARVTEAAVELSNITPVRFMPPTIKAALGYLANYDFWRQDAIWQGPEVDKPELEFNRFTHPAIISLAEATNKSPVRLSFALRQIFTSSNYFGNIMSGGVRELLDEMPPEQRERTRAEIFVDNPVLKPLIRRVARFTTPSIKRREEKDKARLAENSRRLIQTQEIDRLTDIFHRTDRVEDQQAILAFIQGAPQEDQDRLLNRFRVGLAVADLPERFWWLSVARLSPKPRAQVWLGRFQAATPEQRQQLLEGLTITPGFDTEEFRRELIRQQGAIEGAR